MTRCARIRNFIFVRHRRRYESECVRTHLNVRNGCLDLWHMTSNAAATRRSFFVMRMLFKRAGARPVQGKRAVTIQA